jgi:hypothetical protein
MSFAKQWPAGLTDDASTLTAAKLMALDTNVSRALDGTAGGTYQPTGHLVHDGSLGGLLKSNNFVLTALLTMLSTSPAQITGSQNNYAGCNGFLVCRLTSDGNYDITGLAGGAADRLLIVINAGTFTLTLKHESASSTAANRFKFVGAADKALAPDGVAILFYDGATTRWRALA